jgi:membrane protease YdiL (CAAX protease family)
MDPEQRGGRVDEPTKPTDLDPLARGRNRSFATMTVVLAILVATNVLLSGVAPSWAYIPVILGASILAVVVAQRGGATLDDLGLGARHVRRSLLVGLLIGGAIAAVVLASLAVPGLRDIFVDDRYANLGAAALAYQALVRIPLGTALGEELLFRSVALGVALPRWSVRIAITASSALFGLWHIIPSLESHASNSVATGIPVPLLVVATVGITGLAGAAFAGLRLWTGHVAAPVIVHAALNASALVAATVV